MACKASIILQLHHHNDKGYLPSIVLAYSEAVCVPGEKSDPVQAIRSGNYPVVIKDHVLLLNWNRQVQPLLRQLALNSREDALSRGPSMGRRET